MGKTAKLTLDCETCRWSIGIDGVSQDGFSLFWNGQGTTEFRRTSTGTVEHVTVSGLPQKLDRQHEGEIVSLSHPGSWAAPAQEEEPDFNSEAADAPDA